MSDADGARCSVVVEHPIIVQCVVGSIPRGGPIEYFLFKPIKAVVCAILGWCI